MLLISVAWFLLVVRDAPAIAESVPLAVSRECRGIGRGFGRRTADAATPFSVYCPRPREAFSFKRRVMLGRLLNEFGRDDTEGRWRSNLQHTCFH